MTISSQETAAVDAARDKVVIRELIENWVIWRDAGDWDRFAGVWHDDGRMVATWCEASASQFIAGCRNGFEAGNISIHALGGSCIDLNASRAVAQTKMQIVFRGILQGTAVIVTCMGRFVDALEKRDGRWGIVLRQPVYELDWLIPENPAAAVAIDQDLLTSFPIGYRHMAYVQTQAGITVRRDLPGLRGPEGQALFDRMARWLDGSSAGCLQD